MSEVPRVVIIGGGFGGLDAARALDGAPVSITLIDRHNYHLFQPLLYQVATASLSPGDIASPIRWILRKQSNVRVILASVTAIDPVSKQLTFEEGRPEPFDFLILATGATHAYFGHPDWASRAPGLKTLDDALEIRRRLLIAFERAERDPDPALQRRMLTFVIVGGGPTGVELAGALAEIARHTLVHEFHRIQPASANIILVEGSPHLIGAFPESLREAAAQSLRELGVVVRTNTIVTGVDETGVKIGDEHLEAGTVLWAAGVAASPLARSLRAPLDRAGRVLVEPTLNMPGRSDMFVVGDLCALQQDGKWLPGVAQVAKQEGAHAARNVLRAVRGEALQPFRYRDYGSMATVGRGSAVAEFRGIKASGVIAWFIWLFVHIFWLIGFRNRLAVLGEWALAYITMHRRIRLITGDRHT